MANQAYVAAKAAQAEEIAAKLKAASSVVVVDYRGYTVEEVTNLRKQMRENNIEYIVLKNNIVERAAQSIGADEEFLTVLKGPSAFAFCEEDAVAPARILKKFIAATKKGALKGGLIDGKFTDGKELQSIADLPSREDMIAKILGSLQSPLTELALVLKAIAEKVESGEDLSAPKAEAAAPEAEVAPVEEVAADTEAPAAEDANPAEEPEA